MKRKILSVILTAALALSALSSVSLREEGVCAAASSFDESVHGKVIRSGNCGDKGDNVKYKLFNDGAAYFYGEGKISSFYYNPTEVYIEEGITGISSSVFNGCDNMVSIKIPYNVEEIGYKAFRNCISLKTIEIPSKVAKIGDNAFENCRSLESIEIPSGVTEIGEGLVNGCTNLKSIKVAGDNKVYDAGNGCNAIIETESNKLIAGCKNTKIPDSVECLGTEAFKGCNGLTDIELPEGINTIENGVFDGCSGLTAIEIPASVGYIGSSVFDNCGGLESIKVREGNKKYDSRENCNAIIDSSFNKLVYGCKNTKIPEEIGIIGYSAFFGCDRLAEIKLPDNTEEIDGYAFAGCCSLAAIEIPARVKLMSDFIFAGCSDLKSIKVAKENTVFDSREDCNAIIETETNTLLEGCRNTKIPDSVTTIGRAAFYFRNTLENIEISKGVTTIKDYAFEGCEKLKRVKIPANVIEISDYGVFSYEYYSNMVIYGEKDSAAESYAASKNIKFKPITDYETDIENGSGVDETPTPTGTVKPTVTPDETDKPTKTPVSTVKPIQTPDATGEPTGTPDELLLGDVDGNGKIELADVTLVLKAALKITKLTEQLNIAGDVDKNEKIELADVTLILKAALKLVNL